MARDADWDVGLRGAPVEGVLVGTVVGEGLPCKAILFRVRRAWWGESLGYDFSKHHIQREKERGEEEEKWK